MEYVLQTHDLSKVYGGKYAVNKVSMHVKKGDIYGFIGKNGAGKTTLMRLIIGLAKENEGSLSLFGSDNLALGRKRIGSIIETPSLYPNMTAKQNLEYYRILFGITDKESIIKVLSYVGLENVGKKKTKQFSLGMKQRLAIAIALLGNPDFLILDEPINGLDPMGIKDVRDLLLKLNEEKQITILISSHILGELAKIATCYGIINKGTLVDEFSKEELEKRCGRCLKILVDDTKKATYLIEEELKTSQYDLLEDGTIRLFDYLDSPDKVSKLLVNQGVSIFNIHVAGQDLEGYFVERMGGIDND